MTRVDVTGGEHYNARPCGVWMGLFRERRPVPAFGILTLAPARTGTCATELRIMANIKSAAKAARKAVKAQARNTARKSRVRTFVRAVEEALEKGDKVAAVAAMKAAEPEIARGKTKGVLHANTAARKVSRLTKRVNKLAAA